MSTLSVANLVNVTQINLANTITVVNSISVGNSSVNTVVNSSAIVVGSNTATFGTALYVVANGSVGIACTSPLAGYKLTVNGGNIRLQNENGWIAGSNSITLYGDSSSSYGLTVTSNGNTGIGTTAPSGKIHVYGSGDPIIKCESSSSGQAGQFSAIGNGSTSYPGFNLYQGSTGYWSMQMRADTNLYFYRQSGSGDVIIPNGQLGIGAAPSTKLTLTTSLNDGLKITDGTYTGFIGPSGFGGIAIGTQSNHNLVFFSNNASRMIISNAGNLSVGTSTATLSKFNLKGRQRFIASPSSNSYEENRWYSHQGHYNIASVDNNSYSNVLMFRPYQQGTTSDPPGSSLWTRVGVEVRIGGHSSSIGSGDRWAKYSLDYNGSGCSGVTTLQDVATSNAPRVSFSISGWQVTLQVSGAGGAGGSLGGYCFVSLHFGGGEGSYGEAIEWSMTEYL